MTKWEYCDITLFYNQDRDDYFTNIDGELIEGLVNVLNHYGANGWRLVKLLQTQTQRKEESFSEGAGIADRKGVSFEGVLGGEAKDTTASKISSTKYSKVLEEATISKAVFEREIQK